jgi:hypothetical protein
MVVFRFRGLSGDSGQQAHGSKLEMLDSHCPDPPRLPVTSTFPERIHFERQRRSGLDSGYLSKGDAGKRGV